MIPLKKTLYGRSATTEKDRRRREGEDAPLLVFDVEAPPLGEENSETCS